VKNSGQRPHGHDPEDKASHTNFYVALFFEKDKIFMVMFLFIHFKETITDIE